MMERIDDYGTSEKVLQPSELLSPKFIALEITSRCQLACKGCFSSPADYPKGDMSFEYFKSVLDRMDPETMLLNPYANGEPLLHPKIVDMIRYMIERKIKGYITTNGMIFNEELFTMMMENSEQCYQLLVSLDGLPGSDSIVKARPGSNPEKILSTIDKLCELKLKLKSKTDLMVKICKRGQDFEEIEEYISFFLQKPGISAVCVGNLLTDYHNEGFRRYPCQYSDSQFMLIRWDGTVVTCMYHPEVMSYGKLSNGVLDEKTPLIEFYNNEKYRTFRKNQRSGNFPDPCDHCGIAYTGAGHRGVLRFRNPKLIQDPIFYRGDYYNHFYSLVDKKRSDNWYGFKKE